MKLTSDAWLRITGKRIGLGVGWGLLLLGMTAGQMAGAQAVTTTTVQGTVYLANGQAGAGTLTVSWPAFTTANGLAVAADGTTVTIAPDGFVSVNLTPNVGATPAGLVLHGGVPDERRNDEHAVLGGSGGGAGEPGAGAGAVDAGGAGGAGGEQVVCGPVDLRAGRAC